MTINFGVDEEIDNTNTNPAVSPSVKDDTWNDGHEEGEIARNVAAGSGAINSGEDLALTDVHAGITKALGCKSAFNAANYWSFNLSWSPSLHGSNSIIICLKF